MTVLMSLLQQVQKQNIEWSHRLYHTGQGETDTIVLKQRQAGTNQIIDLLAITKFRYSERGINGENLPPNVLFELHIAEELLTNAQVKKIAAIDHDKQRFEIVQIAQGEPGIFHPHGAHRFWRFWLAPLEELP